MFHEVYITELNGSPLLTRQIDKLYTKQTKIILLYTSFFRKRYLFSSFRVSYQ